MPNPVASRRSPRRARWLVTWLAAVVAATTLVACSSDTRSDSGPSDTAVLPAGKGTDAEIDQLTWGGTGPIRSFDPAHGFDGGTWSLIQTVLEPLVTMKSDGTLAPALATEWKQLDETRLELTLRDDVTFWDGQPMTSDDVVFSLTRIIDPAVAAEHASYFSNMASVKATSASSIEITLKVPQPEFVSYLALAMVMEKKHALAAGDHLGDPTGLVMGTGAFKVTEYSPSKGVTLVRNDDYWGPKPSVARIEHEVIPDPQALKLAMQSGEIDGTFGVPLSESQAWDELDDVEVGYAAGTGNYFFILDPTTAPFDDIHARRAFAHVVDQKGIIRAVFNDHASTSKSIASPLLWANFATDEQVDDFYGSLPDIEYDLDAAKAELEKSATPTGFSVTITVPSDSNPSFTPVAEAIKESAKQVGIDVTIKRAPGGQWLEKLSSDDKDPLGVLSYAALASTPLALPLSLVSTDSTPSPWSGYQSSTAAAGFEKYKSSQDQAGQRDAAEAVVSDLATELPFVPVAVPDVPIALSSDYVYAAEYSAWNAYGGINWAAHIKVAAK